MRGIQKDSSNNTSSNRVNIIHTEDDHTSNNIRLSRSDGVHHDLNTVFANASLANVVSTSIKDSEGTSLSSTDHTSTEHHDHENISITRSDGITHDLIQVLRYSSADNNLVDKSTGETVKLSRSRNPSVAKIDLTSVNSARMEYYPKNVRIVHMSDTHSFLTKNHRSKFLPEGDILIHTGNFTCHGKDEEFHQFNAWLDSVSDIYHYRVICLGSKEVKQYGNNFDTIKKLLSHATHVLCHEEATILGIRFYGAPWNWAYKKNFTLRLGAPTTATSRFDDIPTGVHVLLTHVPAYDRLDSRNAGDYSEHWGSRELAEALRRVRPAVHLHGHVKDNRGFLPAFSNYPLTLNSAMCDIDATVMYAAPHVVKATQVFTDVNKNVVNWSFAIDSLDT